MAQTYIIAEAGVNHNGSEDLAIKMIQLSKKMDVDAIKFQLFKAESLVTQKAEQAQYQKKASLQSKTQFEMLKELELSYACFQRLQQVAKEEKIDLL